VKLATYLFTVCLLSGAFGVLAVETTAQSVVEKIVLLAKSSDVATNEKIKEEINSLVDFEMLAKNILGKNLNKVNDENLWFIATIKEILTRTVYPKCAEFLNDVKVSYIKSESKGDVTVITSNVTKKLDETEVTYTLQKRGYLFVVIDIAIDGESWTKNIGEQVSATITKESWGGLKKKLNAKLAKLKLE